MNKKLGIGFLFLFLFSFSFVLAEENLSLQDQAVLCLADSANTLSELNDSNFNTLRVNVSLEKANNLYESQLLLKQKTKTGDFSLILPICKEISDIRKNAYDARDALGALEKFYSDSGLDSNEINALLDEIKSEIDTERYEKVFPLVDTTYDKILTVESEKTALNLFYRSTTETLMDLLHSNWRWLSITAAFFLGLLLIYRTAIMSLLLKRKLKNLELRKDSLKDLVGNTQKNYFQFGKISEREYEIRTRNFAEMIRDIDRQIPLVEERLVKYGHGRKSKALEAVKDKEEKREKKIKKDSKNDLKKDLKKRFKKEKRKSFREFKKSKKGKN